MKYDRIHNFAAGPAVLPLPVVEALREQLPNLDGAGIGLMEISHRSATFDAVCRSAQQGLREILAVPDSHEVLFLQGGASLQFLMVPLNLMGHGGKADYINTGTWSTKAIKEASAIGDVQVVWDGKEAGFRAVPSAGDYQVRSPAGGKNSAAYLHYTSNNTIAGTAFMEAPESAGLPLVCDMSSDIASHAIDVGRHAVIYAGAQKNMGPSGVTIVIVQRDLLGRLDEHIPTYMDYRTHIKAKTLFNTPNTLGIFVINEVVKWIRSMGGAQAMASFNDEKAGKLYAELDRSDFWRPHAAQGSRSWMNVTWRIADPELEPVFIKEALAEGLSGLKGHRSVGGLRASIYNACPMESVDCLIAFMREFEARNG